MARLSPLAGSASDSGIKYELKITSLLVLRACRQDLIFQIHRNVAAANPCDDVVLHVTDRGITRLALIQLKHAETKDALVSVKAFCPKKKEMGKTETGDFNLRKYFNFFKRFHEVHEMTGDPPSIDEKTLSETPLERVWYIIYTNKVVTHKANSDSYNGASQDEVRETTEDVKLLGQLLSTNPERRSFRFTHLEKLVWSLLEDDEQEALYQKKFLPRLLVYDGQAHVDDLDDLNIQEIKHIFGENLSHETAKEICDNFYEEVERWSRTGEGEGLSERSRALERAAATALRRRARAAAEAASGGVLRFRVGPSASLSKVLRRRRTHRHVHISTPGAHTAVRAVKLLQVLDGDTELHSSWTYINDKIFDMYPRTLLRAACIDSDAIILDVENSSNHPAAQDLIDRAAAEKLVVVVDSSLEYSDRKLTLLSPSVISDEWNFGELCEDSQKLLLERSIIFQGEKIPLTELEAVWPELRQNLRSAEISALAVDQPLEVGVPLLPPSQQPLISRSLRHRPTLHSDILKVASESDAFVLRGFPEELLRQLRERGSKWQECTQSWEPIMASNSTILLLNKDGETTLRKSPTKSCILTLWVKWLPTMQVLPHSTRNVHWLIYNNGHILWEGSSGDASILIMHKMKANCQNNPTCIHKTTEEFLDWKDDILLIDLPGMGKTFFLKDMAKTIKRLHKTCWVIFIEMKEILKKGQIMEKESLNKILVEAATSKSTICKYSLEDIFLQYSLRMGNFFVLVDGVDEECPVENARTLKAIRLLRASMAAAHSGGRLWVASRPELEKDLICTLKCGAPLSLQPFSFEDQVSFLLSRWANDLLSLEPKDRERCMRAVVKALREATAANGRSTYSLSDVPLYSHMATEVFTKSDLERILRLVNGSFEPIINGLYLYTKFVSKTLNHKWEREDISKSVKVCLHNGLNRNQMYKQLAVKECFGDHPDIEKILSKNAKQICGIRYKQMLAKDSMTTRKGNGKLQFIHRSMAEFLAASWLSEHYFSLPQFTKALYTADSGVCRYFLDATLAKDHPLHEAALAGRLENFKEVLDEKKSTSEKDAGGRLPLHLAAIGGHVAVVRFLLPPDASADADVHVTDTVLRYSPLRYADIFTTCTGPTTSHLDIVEVLLEHGGSPRDIPKTLKDRRIVEYAIRNEYEAVTMTVMKRISRSAVIHTRKEFVQLAMQHESVRVLRAFQDNGSLLRKAVKADPLALHRAASSGSLAMCDLLLSAGARVNARDKFLRSPLHYAAFGAQQNLTGRECSGSGDIMVQPNLTQRRRRSGGIMTGYHYPYAYTSCVTTEVDNSYASLFRMLLEHGADVNATTTFGITALHFAATVGAAEVCRTLLAAGAGVGMRDSDQLTPLHWAALRGHAHVCDALVTAAADLNARDRTGLTPLHWATVWERADAVRMLLRRGARVDGCCYGKRTPLHRAARQGSEELCKVLVAHGASVNARDGRGKTPLLLAAKAGAYGACLFLIRRGASLDAVDYRGWTPLLRAARHGTEDVCRALLAAGANARACLPGGRSALHVAARAGHDGVRLLLIAAGARVNCEDSKGDTPLSLAKAEGREAACRTLVECGAVCSGGTSRDTPH